MDDKEKNVYGEVPPPPPQPNQPASSSIKPPGPFSFIKKTILIVFVIICLFGVWNTVIPVLFPSKQIQNTNSQTNSPSQAVQLKTYTNKKYNYSVNYPDTLAVSEETPYSTVFMINPKPVARLVFPTFYVSVIPDGFTNQKGEVYNFMSAEVINRFYTMQDNESLQTESGTNAEYWTFKKLATIPLVGTEGVVIQNDNVFEGEGYANRRILIKKDGFTYILGSYFQSQEELTSFHDFVMSFTFL